MRSELLELASELENGSDHDATQVALVHELLRDGASPLYDPNVPVSSLHEILSRARDAGCRVPGCASGARLRNRPNLVRWTIPAVGAIGLAIVFGLAGAAGAAKSKKHTFTENVIAASITPDGSKSVGKITDSVDGPGAGTTTSVSTSTSYPFKGTDTNISYFADGVQFSTDTFTIEKPDAKGISKFTAKGRCAGGTRKHKSVKCTFTESGTVDTNPGGVAKIKVVGTYRG